MAEFSEVMEHKKRIHNHIIRSVGCLKCPLYSKEESLVCTVFMEQHPQEAEEIIMKWASENPIKIT